MHLLLLSVRGGLGVGDVRVVVIVVVGHGVVGWVIVVALSMQVVGRVSSSLHHRHRSWGRGGGGLGVIDTGRGVMGQVIVIVLSTQVVGS